MPRFQCYLLLTLGCLWAQLVTPRPDSLDRASLVELSESDTPLEQDASVRAQKAAKVVLAKIVDDEVRKAKVAAGLEMARAAPKCVDDDPKACLKAKVCTDEMRLKCKKTCNGCPPKGYVESKSEYARVTKLGMKTDALFDREFNKRLYGEASKEKVREATFARAMASRTKKMASFAAQEVALAAAKVKKWKQKAAKEGSFAEANMATQALKLLANSKHRYAELTARAKELDFKASQKSVGQIHLKIGVLLQGCQVSSEDCPHGEVYWGEIAAMRRAAAEINKESAGALEGVDKVKLPTEYRIQLVEQLFADMDELLMVAGQLAKDSTVLAVIAPGSSLFTTAITPIFRAHSKTVIGWGAHATALSSQKLYPNFNRMTHSTSTPTEAVIEVLRRYVWDRVGVIMNLDSSLDTSYKIFAKRVGEDSKIAITSTVLDIPSEAPCNLQQIVAKLRYMAATKPKAVVFWPYSRATSARAPRGCLDNVVTAAEIAGLFSKEITWVLTDDAYFQLSGASKARMEGALMLQMAHGRNVEHWKTNTMAKICNEGAKEAWAVGEGQKTSGRCCRGKGQCITTGRRSVLAYDSIYAAAHAMAKAVDTGAATPEAVLEVINRLQFNGLSGPVLFDARGDRRILYDLLNVRNQAASIKYVKVGSYNPTQFEGQRLVVPSEDAVVLHFSAEAYNSGPCWVGGDHPFLHQACKTCTRRTTKEGINGHKNSCTSCHDGSTLYPSKVGGKIGECRAVFAPFTCTTSQLAVDKKEGPASCINKEKCRQCRGQCVGFKADSATARSVNSIMEGSSAPTFCPPFWESYGSEFNYHTSQDCLPKITPFGTPGAPLTCTKATTVWEPRFMPRTPLPVIGSAAFKESPARPSVTTLGMFYSSPNMNKKEYIHAELLEEGEGALGEAHGEAHVDVVSMNDPAPVKSSVKLSLSHPTSEDFILTASACQCSKRVDCDKGACNSAKTCTCAEACYITTGPNRFEKCRGGILRTALSTDLVQSAVGSALQPGDYCCYVECKVPSGAPEFMQVLAEAKAFCTGTLTGL